MHSRSSSRRVRTRSTKRPVGLGTLLTTLILAILLGAGPLILGGARLWSELPVLTGVALLLVLQGVRLAIAPRPETPRTLDALDLGVALFVLYTLARWLTSPIEQVSRIEAMEVTAYAGVFWTCRYGMASRWCCIMLLYLLVLLGVGETIFGYVLSQHSYAGEPDSLWYPFGPAENLHVLCFPRWIGTYESPNHYASLLIMALGAALALGGFSKLSWPTRIVLFYLAAVMMVGLVYSASRGSLVAFLAALVALVAFGIRNGSVRWWVPVLGALVLIVAACGLLTFSHEAKARVFEGETLVAGGKLSHYGRVELAHDALRITRDHPAWGTGPGTFLYVHPHYEAYGFSWGDVLTHNDYLNCLADYGLAGFGLAVFVIALITFRFFSPLWVDNRWQDRVLVATGLAAWAALLVHSWVDYNLHIPGNAMLLFALTGLAMGRINKEAKRHWSTISLAPLDRGLGWALVVFALAFSVEAARSAAGDITYEHAAARTDSASVTDLIQETQQSLVYDDDAEPALLLLGDLYCERSGFQKNAADKNSDAQQALDAYQKAFRANPLDDVAEASIGRGYDALGRYDDGYPYFKKAVAARPNNAHLWLLAGRHFEQAGDLRKAQEALYQSANSPWDWTPGQHAIYALRARPEMKDQPWPVRGANPFLSPPDSVPPVTAP
jgi:O-antigen ligase